MSEHATKRGLDKFIKPYGFLDEFLVGNIGGLIALGIFFMSIIQGRVDTPYLYGVLAGLICGQIAICAIEASRAIPKYRKFFRTIYLFLIFGNIVVLAFFSTMPRVGYIIGLFITITFGTAISALIKNYRR